MHTYETSSSLKATAKELLLGKYNVVITATLLPEIITLLIAIFASSLIDTTTIFGTVVNYAVSFILSLITAIFTVGQLYIYMKIYTNLPAVTSDVFFGFRLHPDKAILLKLIPTLYASACYIPAIISVALFSITGSIPFMVLSSLTFVIGSIAAIVIFLHYSQAFLLLIDFPDKSTIELLRMSKELMKGHKGRLFYIYVSFLPLLFLSLFTCGIGLLFLTPYMNMTVTAFFFDLMKHKK